MALHVVLLHPLRRRCSQSHSVVGLRCSLPKLHRPSRSQSELEQELTQEWGTHVPKGMAGQQEDQSVCSRVQLGRWHRCLLQQQQQYQPHRRSVLDFQRTPTQPRKGSSRWLLAGRVSQLDSSGLSG